jgi:hypothetical protein
MGNILIPGGRSPIPGFSILGREEGDGTGPGRGPGSGRLVRVRLMEAHQAGRIEGAEPIFMAIH